MTYQEMERLLEPLRCKMTQLTKKMSAIREAYASSQLPFKKGDRVRTRDSANVGTVSGVTIEGRDRFMISITFDKSTYGLITSAKNVIPVQEVTVT